MGIEDQVKRYLDQGPTYSDEYIDRWAEVYLRLGVKRYGILFETFLRFPEEIVKGIEAESFRPLLPSQEAVQARLDRAEAAMIQAAHENSLEPRGVCVRGDKLIEPLRHHSFACSRTPDPRGRV